VKTDNIEIAEVLCDSGEQPLEIEPGNCISGTEDSALERTAHMLDHAYLNNVVVVKGKDGKFYVGEFCFDFNEVSEEEAKRIARDFSNEM